MNTKCVGNHFEDDDRGVSGAALNPADIGPIKVCFEAKLLLGPAVLQPDPLDVESDLFANVHTGNRPSMSIIGLRTMSHDVNIIQ